MQLILMIAILLQVIGPSKSLAQSNFSLSVGNVEATIENVSADKVDRACLANALQKVRDLYNSNKLEPIKAELTTDHETVKELRSNPHAILPIENSKTNLVISLIADGSTIVPLEGDWKPGETYRWLSASGKSTGIASCTK